MPNLTTRTLVKYYVYDIAVSRVLQSLFFICIFRYFLPSYWLWRPGTLDKSKCTYHMVGIFCDLRLVFRSLTFMYPQCKIPIRFILLFLSLMRFYCLPHRQNGSHEQKDLIQRSILLHITFHTMCISSYLLSFSLFERANIFSDQVYFVQQANETCHIRLNWFARYAECI